MVMVQERNFTWPLLSPGAINSLVLISKRDYYFEEKDMPFSIN